jgi:outer membrane protein
LLFTVATAMMTPSSYLTGQTKIGFISMDEIVAIMPESKKADTALAEYKNMLSLQFDAYKTEYLEQDGILHSRDTAKYSKVQLMVKKDNLLELQSKIQGFNDQARLLMNQKYQELMFPIQKKALEALRIVSKEYGYNFVFEKNELYIYPEADDLFPLVKKKLGLK